MASITRRQLGVLLGTVAAVPAQTPPAQSSAAQPDDLQAAREQNQKAAESLAKIEVPIAGEPAFHFKA